MSENKSMGPCRTCGEQIARSAKVCPKCGQKKPVKRPFPKRYLIYIGVVLLVVYLVPDNRPIISGPEQMAIDAKANLANLCKNAIRASVTNISTLDLDHTGEYSAFTNGGKQYVWGFSAKNAYGLELYYSANCKLQADGKFNFHVTQQEK